MDYGKALEAEKETQEQAQMIGLDGLATLLSGLSKVNKAAGLSDKKEIRDAVIEKDLGELVEGRLPAGIDELDVRIANYIVHDDSSTIADIANELECDKDEIRSRLVSKPVLRFFLEAKMQEYKEFEKIHKFRLDRLCDTQVEQVVIKDLPDMKPKDKISVIKQIKEIGKEKQVTIQKNTQNIFINGGVEKQRVILERLAQGNPK